MTVEIIDLNHLESKNAINFIKGFSPKENFDFFMFLIFLKPNLTANATRVICQASNILSTVMNLSLKIKTNTKQMK